MGVFLEKAAERRAGTCRNLLGRGLQLSSNMDSDVINVIVALVVIVGLVRWWSKPGMLDSQ